MLLDILEELGDYDVAGARQGAALDEKGAAADGGHHAVRKREWLSDGRCLIEHLRDRDHVLIRDRGAVLPGLQLHTSPFGKPCPLSPGLLDVLPHWTAMESIDEVERQHSFTVDTWRLDREAIRGRIVFRH